MNTRAGADIPFCENKNVIYDGDQAIGVCVAPTLSVERRIEIARLWAAAPRFRAIVQMIHDRIGWPVLGHPGSPNYIPDSAQVSIGLTLTAGELREIEAAIASRGSG